MIWIITSGAGHHHSAVLCGPRNQPASEIKGAVQAAGELVGHHWKASSQRVTGNGQESPFPKEDCLCNLWSLVRKENVKPLVKLLRMLRWQQQNILPSTGPAQLRRAIPGLGLCTRSRLFHVENPKLCRVEGAEETDLSSSFSPSPLWDDDGTRSSGFLYSAFLIPLGLFSHLKARRYLLTQLKRNTRITFQCLKGSGLRSRGRTVPIIQFQGLPATSHLPRHHLKPLSHFFLISRAGIVERGFSLYNRQP